MDDPNAEIRSQLIILCRRKSSRTSEWKRERPTEWQPTAVINPEDGQPFTDTAAWEFVARCLESLVDLDRVQLEKPAGKIAYVFTVPIGASVLYVKLQLGSGSVIGRSFHYSKTEPKAL
jgi:hypothetical protein